MFREFGGPLRRFAWYLPVDHANEIQTDSVAFDLGFYAEQCRHNDGSGMEPEPPVTGGGNGNGNGENGENGTGPVNDPGNGTGPVNDPGNQSAGQGQG